MKLNNEPCRQSDEQETPSGFDALSTGPRKTEPTGRRLTEVLTLAWARGFSVSSDFARAHAAYVAAAASRGFITTRIDRDRYGTRWLITPKGLQRIWEFRR